MTKLPFAAFGLQMGTMRNAEIPPRDVFGRVAFGAVVFVFWNLRSHRKPSVERVEFRKKQAISSA